MTARERPVVSPPAVEVPQAAHQATRCSCSSVSGFTMKRCPSFSARPGFPKGLKVLVVDCEVAAGVEAEAQLRECGYSPMLCSTTREAVEKLSHPSIECDVMLVEEQCLQRRSADTTQLLAAARSVPMVLMSSMCSPSDLWEGIKRGAVDFLEKPLHMHKLRNIWQHVVRQMMDGDNPANNDRQGAAVGAAQRGGDDAPTRSPASAANSGAGGCTSNAGDSGSNESTSAKVAADAMELDLDAVSLLDDSLIDEALASPLAGITTGFSSLLMGDERACTGDSHIAGSRSDDKAGQPSSSKPPAIGHPAGKLPALTQEGMVWGLPTNPLHITPKVGPMPPPMGLPPWMAQMAPPMMPPLGMMAPMFGGAPPAPNMPPKRSDSTPVGTGDASAATPPGGTLMHSISSADCSASGDCDAPPELLHALSKELEQSPKSAPILGLTLKKSVSLMDLISQSVKPATVAG